MHNVIDELSGDNKEWQHEKLPNKKRLFLNAEAAFESELCKNIFLT